jgi:O-antigen ligase
MKISIEKIRTLLLQLVAFSLPFEYIKVILPQISITVFIFILYLIVFAFSPDKRFYKSHVKKPFLIAVVLYLIILTVSILNYDYRWSAQNSILRQLPFYVLIFFFTANELFFRNIKLKDFLIWYAVGMTAIPLFYFLGLNVSMHITGRTTVMHINPNTVSVYLTVAILIVIHLINRKEIIGITKFYLLSAVIPMLYIIILTGSRGGTISLLLGLLSYYYFKNTGQISRAKNIVKAIVITIILIFIFLSNSLLYQRFFEEDENITDSRWLIWENVVIVAKQEPLFGVGVYRYDQEMSVIIGRSIAAHNEFLSVLVYSGFIGLSLFLWLLYSIYKSAMVAQAKNNNSLFIALLVILAFTLFKGGGALITLFMWMIFGVIYASGIDLNRSQHENINKIPV